MPMGIKQQNDIMRATIDVWEDKVFLNEKEYPAFHFATEVLNLHPGFVDTTAKKALDLMSLLPYITYQPEDEKLAEIFPQIKQIVIEIFEDLSVIEPFSLWNIKEEQGLAEAMFSKDSLNDLRNRPMAWDFIKIYLSALISVPFAVYHFAEAVIDLERNCLCRLDKRTETYFAMGVHDTFNHPEFKKFISETQVHEIEPFTYSPKMTSSYCFARDPKHYGEMIFVNRLFFDRYMDFFVYDLLNGMHHGHAPSKCQNCGRYFLTTDARKPKYCDGMAPQNPHYTCRQYGAMNQQKEKNANHPVFQIYKTRTSTIRKHHQRGKITDEERQEAMKVCEELRDRALFDTEFAQGEYLRLMEQDAIYAEVSRRLGYGDTHDK